MSKPDKFLAILAKHVKDCGLLEERYGMFGGIQFPVWYIADAGDLVGHDNKVFAKLDLEYAEKVGLGKWIAIVLNAAYIQANFEDLTEDEKRFVENYHKIKELHEMFKQ